MRAIIFANGEFIIHNEVQEFRENDLIIAADGGSRHCRELALIPDILIGDLDSVDGKTLTEWNDSGVKVIEFSEEKDQTDLELALLYAQKEDPSEIIVYGAVGGRLDMTMSSLTLLAHPELITPTTIIHGKEKINLLKQGETLDIQGDPGDIVSLIPLQSVSNRVTTKGLQYPLNDEVLEFGSTRGISNCLITNKAQVKLESGLMIVIQTFS